MKNEVFHVRQRLWSLTAVSEIPRRSASPMIDFYTSPVRTEDFIDKLRAMHRSGVWHFWNYNSFNTS